MEKKNLLQYNMATVVKGELFLAYKINDVTSAHQRGGDGRAQRLRSHFPPSRPWLDTRNLLLVTANPNFHDWSVLKGSLTELHL